jgi:tetratricopeptide (TPR) repeat protein
MTEPRTQPFVIAPVPGWLTELVRWEPSRVLVWPAGAGLVVRASSPSTSVLLELSREPAAYEVDAQARPARRRRIELSSAARAAISRFFDRLEWVSGSAGAASERDERDRALMGALRTMNLETAGDERLTASARRARSLAAHEPALETYLRCVEGDWGPVFIAIDSGLSEAPCWLRTVLVGIGGDVEALLALARGSGGQMEVLEGTTLELSRIRDAALDRHRRAVRELAGGAQADVALHVAKMLRESGHHDEAITYIRRGLLARDDEVFLLRAVGELVLSGALDDAHAALSRHAESGRASPDALRRLGEILLWASRTAEARPLLLRAADGSVDALRLDAIRLALDGELAAARELFERAARERPDDMEILLWIAQCAIAAGDLQSAEHAIASSRMRIQTPMHTLLGGALVPPDSIRHRPEVVRLLEHLGEPLEPWMRDPPRAALELVARRFGGNKSERLTLRAAAPTSGLGLSLLRLPRVDSVLSSRDASAELVRTVGAIPLPELERRFDALEAEDPSSPHPHCYRGELDLWLGEYERALARFDTALGITQARWGYVGRAAAEILLGRYDDAETTLARCADAFEPVRGATSHVYLGEMWRLRGEHERALVELDEAIAAKPGRIGARMNRALSHIALGQRPRAEEELRRVEREAPRLLWDAWIALGETPRWPLPVTELERIFSSALALMRGNRSSHTITYFDAAGRFRIARHAPTWRASLGAHATLVALTIRNRLASG